MGLLRLVALIAIFVIVAESRFIPHSSKAKQPSARDVILREMLAKRKIPDVAKDHPRHQTGVKNSAKTPHHNVPVFHPAHPTLQHQKKAPKPGLVKNKQVHPMVKAASAVHVQKQKAAVLKNKKQDVCTTPECTSTAEALIAAMDLSANPCDDFFQFACGGWIEAHPIPSTASSISVFNELRNTLSDRLRAILEDAKKESQSFTYARNHYQSCINTDQLDTLGVQPLVDVLDSDYTGWPMTLDTWEADDTALLQGVGNLLGKGATQHLVTVYVLPDDFNTDETIIYMDQATLGLPRDFYLNPDLAVILDAYRALMTGTAKVVRDAVGSSVTDEQIEAEIDEVLAFETSVAEIMTPDEDRQNFTALYHKMTISELNEVSLNVFDWKPELDYVFGFAGVEIAEDENLVVLAPEYITKYFETLADVPGRTIMNYLAWRYVFGHAEFTNKAMRDLFFEFDKVVYGVTEEAPRWLTCSNLVNDYMGYAISSAYVTQYFPAAAKDEMEELIVNLRAAFDEILDNLPWMDEETKVKAKAKLEKIREFIAYPDWVLDDAAVDQYYEGLTTAVSTLFQNNYNGDSWMWNDMIKTLHKPTNRDAWITPPTIVNAFYYPSMNSITFPAGILQPPFFQSNRLQSLNYGGIGMVIGHEMTHGFDNNGRQYNEDGNLINWWTEETGNAFTAKAQCFVDQYSNYTVPELDEIVPNAHLNGLQTLGENIADNGGMTEAWNAYLRYIAENGEESLLPGLEQFTAQQLFFINFGNLWCGHYTQGGLLNIVLNDEHSPGKYRVWGTNSNSGPFAEAFGCTPSDNMWNGDAACKIW